GIGDNYTLNVRGPGAGVCQSFTPTAGEVSIEGRVLVKGGRTLANTTVTLTRPDGIQRTAVTNSFGVYRFTDVPAGEAYVIVPVSKGYRFTPLVLNITEDLTGVDFIAELSSKR
ncbi:MAG TPA: carboxypeptidase-like regulatory domain-containing protein, partial [Pyrinomonadaceae bacterium]|nr:carboxypeptidase-like regulatory domain-containing protein [Pyrinomonadaceae bacterium]